MLDQRRFCLHLLLMILTINDLRKNAVRTNDVTATGAEYLHNAIRDIQMKNAEQNVVTLVGNPRRTFSTTQQQSVRRLESTASALPVESHRRLTPSYDQHHQPRYQRYNHQHYHTVDHQPSAASHIPDPPSLTKGELASLYEAALSAGNTVHLTGANGDDSIPLQAALHEIHEPYNHHHQVDDSHHHDENHGSGYYYYYYPLKTFLDGLTSDLHNEIPKEDYRSPTHHNNIYTHQHNVKIEPIKTVMEMQHKGNKALEPLFMAISGFVGMAVMFVFSMIILPKLTGGGGNKKKNNVKKTRHLHITPTSTYSGNRNSWSTMFSTLLDGTTCEFCENSNRTARLLDRLYHNRFSR